MSCGEDILTRVAERSDVGLEFRIWRPRCGRASKEKRPGRQGARREPAGGTRELTSLEVSDQEVTKGVSTADEPSP